MGIDWVTQGNVCHGLLDLGARVYFHLPIYFLL